MSDHMERHDEGREGFWSSRSGFIIAWLAFVGIALIIVDHWAHVLGILPYLIQGFEPKLTSGSLVADWVIL